MINFQSLFLWFIQAGLLMLIFYGINVCYYCYILILTKVILATDKLVSATDKVT